MSTVEIPLTQGKVAIIDEADFALVSQFNWHAAERDRTWYAATNRDRRSTGEYIYMHRLIAEARGMEHVDHRNGNGLDNTRDNLRACTNQQNRHNTRKTRGVSQYKGVSIDHRQPGRPWAAYIWIDNKKTSLGSYPTEVEAARAYNAAAVIYHKEFANLNVIQGLSYEESVLAPVRNHQCGNPGKRSGNRIAGLERSQASAARSARDFAKVP